MMASMFSAQSGNVLVSSLLNRKIIDADGHVLGHVADIQISPTQPYTVQGLLYGQRGWLYRLHILNTFTARHLPSQKATRVSWEMVGRVEPHAVFLKQGASP